MRLTRTTASIGTASLLVAATAIAVAVTHDGEQTRLVPAQAAIGYRLRDTQPPGTALPDGLRVPRATRLVGTPFPDVSAGRPVGWRATFVLTGDPAVAFDDLTSIVAAVTTTGQAHCSPIDQARRLRAAWCNVSGRSPQLLVQGSVFYESRRGNRWPSDGAQIVVFPNDGSHSRTPQPVRHIEPVFPPFRATFVPPPDVGDTIDRFSDFQGTLRIEPGSEAITTAVNSELVVRVTGDPSEVFESYTEQFASIGGLVDASGKSRFGEWRSLYTDNTHDVGNAYLLMVTNSTGSWLQIRLI